MEFSFRLGCFLLLGMVAGFYAGTTFATPLILHSEIKKYPMGHYMSVLKETKGTSIDEIRTPETDRRFVQSFVNIPSYGIDREHPTYWAKMEVTNPFSSPQHVAIEVLWARIDQLKLYLFNPQGTSLVKTTGQAFPLSSRDIKHISYVFDVYLEPGKSTLYLSLDTEFAVQLPVILWDHSAFIEKMSMENIFIGFFYGVLVTLVLYNLIIYFVIRDVTHLFYVAYVIASVFFYFTYQGVGSRYIWPESPYWAPRAFSFFVALSGIAGVLFGRVFLKTSRHTPRLDKFLIGMIGLFAIGLILPFSISQFYVNVYSLLLVTFMVWVMLLAGWLCLKKGAYAAKYYLIGWGVFFIGVMLVFLDISTLIPASRTIKEILHFGSFFEIVIFSLAIKERVYYKRKDNYLAQQKVLEETEKALLAKENMPSPGTP